MSANWLDQKIRLFNIINKIEVALNPQDNLFFIYHQKHKPPKYQYQRKKNSSLTSVLSLNEGEEGLSNAIKVEILLKVPGKNPSSFQGIGRVRVSFTVNMI